MQTGLVMIVIYFSGTPRAGHMSGLPGLEEKVITDIFLEIKHRMTKKPDWILIKMFLLVLCKKCTPLGACAGETEPIVLLLGRSLFISL